MKSELKHRRFLIVSRFDENLEWITLVPPEWRTIIYDKTDIAIGNPPGREAHTYLLFIVENYERLVESDEIVFCQGHPFDHDPNFIANLSNPDVTDFGIPYDSPSNGEPHTNACRCDEYCIVFGMPQKVRYRFVAGAQFRLSGAHILQRRKCFYEALLALTTLDRFSAWTLERLWKSIFTP